MEEILQDRAESGKEGHIDLFESENMGYDESREFIASIFSVIKEVRI